MKHAAPRFGQRRHGIVFSSPSNDANLLIPRVRVVHQNPHANATARCALACCAVPSLATVLLLVFCFVFYPSSPNYSVCTQTFDWSALIRGAAAVQTTLSYDVLVSVENQNRFGMQLSDIDVTFAYNREVVGTMILGKGKGAVNQGWKGKNETRHKMVLPPTSIVDMLVRVRFTPSILQASEMYEALYSDEGLVLRIDGTVEGAGTILGFQYPVKYHIDGEKVDMGALSDRSLCKCEHDDTTGRGDQIF